MDNDPIMSLRGAIEALTNEIRTMRGNMPSASSPSGDAAESTAVSGTGGIGKPSSPQNVLSLSSTEEGKGIAEEEGRGNASLDSLAELREESLKAQEELDQLVSLLSQREEELAACDEKLQHAKQSILELEERKSILTTDIAALEEAKNRLAAVREETTALEEQLSTMESQRAELEERKNSVLAREAEVRAGVEKAKLADEMLRKLWPHWFSGDELGQWKEMIEDSVFSDNSPPSFALLFAAIHGYNASLRDPDNRILLDSLRDLGRRLYRWLRDLGNSEESMAQIAEKWAAAINGECGELCALQIAVPGNPANNKWMNFSPKIGSAPDVKSVRSWCVLDNQGRPIHRAEITV